MGIELRMPNITAATEREQLLQIRSYLYQFIPQLQYALNNLDTASTGYVVQQNAKGNGKVTSNNASVDALATFNAIKSLIIKSAEIVEAYYDEIHTRLDGVYVAVSDFGTFAEKTSQDIVANSTYVEQQFTNIQAIITGEIDDLNASFSNSLDETDSRITDEVKALTSTIDTKIDGVNALIDDVNASIEKTDEEIVGVNTRIDETNERIGQTNDRIDEANEKIIAVEDAIANTNTLIDGVNASIASTNEEIRGLNDSILDTNGKIDGLTDTIENTNANIDVLIEAKDLNAEDVLRLNGEISKINGSIDEINTNVENIDSEVKTIDSHVKEVDGQVSEINTSVSSIADLTLELDESVSNVERSVEDTNAKVDETSGEIANLNATVADTTEKVNNLNSAVENVNEDIAGLKAAVIEANAYIRSGLLYYDDNAFPVYGLEIGQKNHYNGEEVFNKFARFTADRLSFYDQNDQEVAYISDYKLYITHVQIRGSLQEGGYKDFVDSSGGVVTKWVGGDG